MKFHSLLQVRGVYKEENRRN